MLVASVPEGEAEQHACPRRLVGCSHALPLVSRTSQRRDRRVPVPLGEDDLPEGEVNQRVVRSRAPPADLVRVDDLLGLGRRAPRRLEIACRDRDLDVRRQAPEPEQRISRVLETPGYARDRGIDLALREPKQRETRLRLAAQLVRHAVRLLGAREVAAPPADLSDLVVAARGDRAVEVVELLARGDGLRLGSRPVASKAERLRPVDAAGARKARHVELVAPTIRGIRPLGGSPVVADVLAGADREAVDDPGRVRSQVAAHRRGGRLVEEPKPLVDLALLDVGATLAGEREHLEVAVADARRRLVGALEELERAPVVPFREERGDRVHERQPGVLGRLGLVGEQAFARRQPASCHRVRAATLVIPREDQGKPGRAEGVTRRRVGSVRALPQGDGLVELPAPPGRLAEALEIGCGQLGVGGLAERGVRRAPTLSGSRLPRLLEGVQHLRHLRLRSAGRTRPAHGR